MTTSPPRAVIWCAVSTKPQATEDKDSLGSQEREARALCEREGWQIAAVLRVPGHSRNYIDIHRCAADMRKQGIDAFDRLLELWSSGGLDILICRDADRFARTQTLLSYIAETTVFEAGARIYSMADGWIDERNVRMWISMAGYRAAGSNDDLTRKRVMGSRRRVERGLSSKGVSFGFKLERRPYGDRSQSDRLLPDPDKRRMIDDMATVLLDRVGWNRFGKVLYQRFGHVNPETGKPYERWFFKAFFHNPYTWGNTAYRYALRYGLWAFDESFPVPEGTLVYRAKHEPLYSGEIAERIKAELRRRHKAKGGRGRGGKGADRYYPFTGLLSCAECGYTLTVWSRVHVARDGTQSRYTWWYCARASREKTCANTHYIKDSVVRTYVDSLLRAVLSAGSFDVVLNESSNGESPATRLETLHREITELEKQIDGLIMHQATAPAILRERYTAQIEAAAERLEILERQRSEMQRSQPDQDRQRVQEIGMRDLAAQSMDQFWALDANRINRILREVFGNVRLVVKDAQIIGLNRG